MTWEPGQPTPTDADKAAWREWRRNRKRQQQRDRRTSHPRIDYYPSPAALEAIQQHLRPWAGGDLSSTINRMVEEWVSRTPKKRQQQREQSHCHRNK